MISNKKTKNTLLISGNIIFCFLYATLKRFNNGSVKVTYVGVCVSVTVGVGQDQHVNVHGVQKRGQGGVMAVISGNLSRTKGSC